MIYFFDDCTAPFLSIGCSQLRNGMLVVFADGFNIFVQGEMGIVFLLYQYMYMKMSYV